MNFLKPILIGAFAFLALNLNAQTSPDNNAILAQYSQDQLDILTTELSLTTDQVTQIAALNSKVIEKIQAIQTNAQLDESKKREFIRGNREDHKRVMSTILDTDQYNEYLELLRAKASDRTEERIEHKEIKTN